MGDNEADGILVSGQLKLHYFSNKSISSVVQRFVPWRCLWLSFSASNCIFLNKKFPRRQSTNLAWHFSCAPVSLCAQDCDELYLIWIPWQMSASTQPICVTQQLYISTIIIFHQFHANRYHLCSNMAPGIHNLFTSYSLQTVSFIWKMTQAHELSVWASTTTVRKSWAWHPGALCINCIRVWGIISASFRNLWSLKTMSMIPNTGNTYPYC